MKKLKVTWQDGSWNRTGEQPIASAVLSGDVRISNVGEDTLVFKDGASSSAKIMLIIPGQRLISAVEAEDDNA